MPTPIENREALYGPSEWFELDEATLAQEPTPEDQEQASWHAEQAQLAEDSVTYWSTLFDREIARLQARKDRQLAPYKAAVEWHRGALERWHRAAHAAGKARKTVHWPSGLTSRLTKQRPKIEVVDQGEFGAWARANGLGHLLKETVRLDDTKRALSLQEKDGEPGSSTQLLHPESGEIVPGVRARILGDSFSSKRGK